MFCQKCGTQNEAVARFCDNCGAALDLGTSSNQTGAAPAAPVTPVADPAAGFYPTPAPAAKAAFDAKKIVKIAIAAVIAIVVVVLGFNIVKGLLGGGEVNYEKHPLVYTKDGEVLVLKAGQTNPEKAFELGNSGEITNIKVTDDGKYIFFCELGSNGSKELCYRKVSDGEKGENKEIKSGISTYKVAPNGKFAVYTKKTDEGKAVLYFSDLKEVQKIEGNVDEDEYYITADSKYIIFKVPTKLKESSAFESSEAYQEYLEKASGSYELHIRKAKLKYDGETKIDEQVQSFYIPFNEDTGRYEYKGVVYYKKNNKLYYSKNGKEGVEVLSDFVSASFIDGQLFATTKDEKSVSAENAKDAEGNYKPGVKSSKDGYVKREYTIHKINGKKAKELEGTFTDANLSKQYAVNGEEYFVLKKNGKLINIGEFKTKDGEEFKAVSENEKYVYVMEDVKPISQTNSTERGTLVRYKLASNGLGKKEEIVEDVLVKYQGEDGFVFTEKGNLFILTADNDGNITLGTFKSKYVEIGEIAGVAKLIDETLYYFEDVTELGGTLNKVVAGKGKVVKIDDDVFDFSIRSANMCYYLKDLKVEEGGDLYIKKGNGKSKQIDDEVTEIKN